MLLHIQLQPSPLGTTYYRDLRLSKESIQVLFVFCRPSQWAFLLVHLYSQRHYVIELFPQFVFSSVEVSQIWDLIKEFASPFLVGVANLIVHSLNQTIHLPWGFLGEKLN